MQRIGQKILATLINTLALISPRLSAKISYHYWTRSFRYPRPRRESNAYDSANKSRIEIAGQSVALYRWGSGKPVLLLHGWNGRATQLYRIAETLVDEGYEVIAPDMPGFGDSEGQTSGVMKCKALVKTLAEQHGPFEAIVAHSFGWLVAINSEPLTICKKLVGVAPPAEFGWLLSIYGEYFGLSQRALSALMNHVLSTYDIESLESISVSGLGAALQMPGLIVYDESDDKIPRAQIDHILDHYAAAELGLTQNMGHTRLLYDKKVAEQIRNFVCHTHT